MDTMGKLAFSVSEEPHYHKRGKIKKHKRKRIDTFSFDASFSFDACPRENACAGRLSNFCGIFIIVKTEDYLHIFPSISSSYHPKAAIALL